MTFEGAVLLIQTACHSPKGLQLMQHRYLVQLGAVQQSGQDFLLKKSLFNKCVLILLNVP